MFYPSRKTTIALAAIAILLIGTGVFIWSFAALPEETPATIHAQATQGTLTVHHANGNAETLTSLTNLTSGDTLETDANSRAIITWGNTGVTRLDPSSAITINTLPAPTQATNTSFSLTVTAGRAWSHLQKLLDLDSNAHVRTSNVVATIRGTSFGVAAVTDGTELAVSDSVIAVQHQATSTVNLIREGRWGKFDSEGKPILIRDITSTDVWPQEHMAADIQFHADLRRAFTARAESLHATSNSPLFDLSKRIRLALIPSSRRTLASSAYLERDIARLALTRKPVQLTTEMNELYTHSSPAARDHLLNVLRVAIDLRVHDLSRPIPDANLDQLQALRSRLISSSPASAAYAGLLIQDDTIDAWREGQLSDVVPSIREYLTSFLNDLPSRGYTTAEETALRDKAVALLARLPEGNLPPNLSLPNLPLMPATNTQAIPPTQQPNVPATTSSPAPSAAHPACDYQRLAIFPHPTTLSIGAVSALTVYGTCANGATDDVTSRVQFSMAPILGTISGAQFTATRPGTVTISATLKTTAGTRTASAQLTIQPATRTPQSITVTTTGGTTLLTSQRVPLEARVHYNDGTSAIVTYQCAWKTSDPAIATISDAMLLTLSKAGTVNAICTYTENGATISGALSFSVQTSSSVQPSTPPGTRLR